MVYHGNHSQYYHQRHCRLACRKAYEQPLFDAGNIAIGIVGGIVGNVVLSVFGISGEGFIGRIIVGAVGACILIALGRAFSK